MVSRQPPPPFNPKHSIANIDVRRFQFGNRLIYTSLDAAGRFLTAEFFLSEGWHHGSEDDSVEEEQAAAVVGAGVMVVVVAVVVWRIFCWNI